jgi:hypothetical protein
MTAIHDAEQPQTLVYRAATLAREIRRDPQRLSQYGYPPKMELATTCCCHICVDDPNFTDGSVAFCIQQAAKQGHAKCLELALLLARSSLTQRRKINHLAWSWMPPGMEPWR